MDQASWTRVPALPGLPSHLLFTKPIRKSDLDTREYRLIKLENGLQALLIHDSHADKAAAAMDVAVGHMADPGDMPGLAHFCEHLLFLGTRAFPAETEYKHYINSHGGATNAYTVTTNTCFHFSVGAAHLPGAIERFSGFFHSPLFDPSCTLRELSAVDSEQRKNDQSDMFRIWQLFKGLSVPGHPFGKFGTGNIATLTQAARDLEKKRSDDNAPPATKESDAEEKDGGFVARETRRRLIDWWEKHYCASIMSLAIIGRESLEDLTKLVLNNFSQVPNRGLTIPTYNRPWGPEQGGKLLLVKTVMDTATLEANFPLDEQDIHYRSKPTTFIANFIGHEGVGSLHSYLKQRGWVTRLWAGAQATGRGFAFFKVKIQLTKTGLEHYRLVLDALYSYLSLLRSNVLPISYFEEHKALQEISFRFSQMQAPDSYVTKLSENLSRRWAKEDILCAAKLQWEYDEKLVREMLEREIAPTAGTVLITAKDLSSTGITGGWQKEKWYGTEYLMRGIDAETLIKAALPNQIEELHLPRPNVFIPQNLTVEKRDISQPAKRPLLISKTATSLLWYKKDDQFWLPKGNIGVFIRSPIIVSSAKDSVMTRFVVRLAMDALTEYAYDASMAGLLYQLKEEDGNLILCQGGYTDKALTLWQHLLEKLTSAVVQRDRFLIYKQEIKRVLENSQRADPYLVAHRWNDYALREVAQTTEELIDEVDDITPEQVQVHIKGLFSRARVNVLLDGNFTQKDALRAQALVDQTLRCTDILPDEAPDLTVLLPPGKNFVNNQMLKNPAQTNNAVQYYMQISDSSDPLVARLRLFAHIVHGRAFNVLRTQEQLGYVVMSSAWIHTSAAGMLFRVQSEKPTLYLESRIDAFLNSLKEILPTIDPNDFEKQRKGLVTKLTQKYVNFDEEFSEFAERIHWGTYDFTAKAKSAALVEHLTIKDMQEFYALYIDPRSKRRAKLSIHLHAQAKPAAKEAISTPTKFSFQASNAFLVDLKAAQIPVDESQYIELSKAEPPLESVIQFWSMHLGNAPFISKETKEQLLARANELAARHPVAAQDAEDLTNKGNLLEGTIVIDDLAEFKKGLPLSKPVVPVMALEVEEMPVDEVDSRS